MFLKFNPALTISLIVIAVALIVICILLIFVFGKKKNPKIKIDDAFIDNLISLYGGKENIKDINIDNARLKVLVSDLDLVNLDGLKANSEAGVFVTGSTIKTLFKYDSSLVKSSIENKL